MDSFCSDGSPKSWVKVTCAPQSKSESAVMRNYACSPTAPLSKACLEATILRVKSAALELCTYSQTPAFDVSILLYRSLRAAGLAMRLFQGPCNALPLADPLVQASAGMGLFSVPLFLSFKSERIAAGDLISLRPHMLVKRAAFFYKINGISSILNLLLGGSLTFRPWLTCPPKLDPIFAYTHTETHLSLTLILHKQQPWPPLDTSDSAPLSGPFRAAVLSPPQTEILPRS
eukprot:1147947-Pelagomonas_calceolata.AAC.7